MQCILEHTLTHFKRYYEEVEVKNGAIYIETELDVSKLNDGEYRLFLFNDSNEILSSDLVRLGDYKIENNKVRIFKQYGK